MDEVKQEQHQMALQMVVFCIALLFIIHKLKEMQKWENIITVECYPFQLLK